MMVNQRRYGPVPATHTGICPICKQRRKVSPTDGRIVRHGVGTPCGGYLHVPVPGSLYSIPPPLTPQTCKAVWNAPGSGWDYPCNILDGISTNGRAHKYPDIHRHTSNGLTIEWIDSTVSPTEQTGGPQ